MVFLSLFSKSPFNLFVALCSASFRLSKSEVTALDFEGKFGLKGVPLLKSEYEDLRPDGFFWLNLLICLFADFFQLLQFFFLELLDYQKSLMSFFGLPEIVNFVFFFPFLISQSLNTIFRADIINSSASFLDKAKSSK